MCSRYLPIAITCSVALGLLSSTGADEPHAGKQWVFIGTYTGGKTGSKGIYRSEFDAESGKLTAPELAAEVASPSFLAVHPSKQFLYAVGELSEFNGKNGGAVNALSLDAKTGRLKLLNQQSSGGAGPCHLIVDREGKNVLVANYEGGSVCVLPIQAGGKLGEATAFIQHQGKGANPQRQEGPHAHSINVGPHDRFAVAADLGLDELLVYKYDAEKGTLLPNDPPFLKVAEGAGPRHFAFHPSKPWAYVINELNCTLNVLDYTPDGKFEIKQTISTLPGQFKNGYSTAEVVVHPSGKFVYGSNRGHHSIVAFKVDPDSGQLSLSGHQGEGIKTPRNFNIDLSGKYLIVANQDGNSLVVFRIDPESGKLEPTGNKVEAPVPVCVKFVAKP
jgi:6-phosphogluconolactonase